jgi:hypothetical protein
VTFRRGLLHRKDDFMTSHTHLIVPSQGLKIPEKKLQLVGCV